MKRRRLVAAMSIVAVLMTGTVAFAASEGNETASKGDSTSMNADCAGMGIRSATGKRGFEFVTDVLKNKFKVTDEEIQNGRSSGKTLNDVATDKGVTQEQLRDAMVEEKVKSIDEAIAEGKVSKEEGEALKTRIRENAQNCTGTPAQAGKRGKGAGSGCSMNCGGMNNYEK